MINIACGFAVGKAEGNGQPVLDVLAWSETISTSNGMASPYLTSNRAPRFDTHNGQPLVEVYTEGFPAWVAVGSTLMPSTDLVFGSPRTRGAPSCAQRAIGSRSSGRREVTGEPMRRWVLGRAPRLARGYARPRHVSRRRFRI